MSASVIYLLKIPRKKFPIQLHYHNCQGIKPWRVLIEILLLSDRTTWSYFLFEIHVKNTWEAGRPSKRTLQQSYLKAWYWVFEIGHFPLPTLWLLISMLSSSDDIHISDSNLIPMLHSHFPTCQHVFMSPKELKIQCLKLKPPFIFSLQSLPSCVHGCEQNLYHHGHIQFLLSFHWPYLGLYCVVNLFSVIKGSVANRYCMVTIGPCGLYALVVSKQWWRPLLTYSQQFLLFSR